MERETAVARKRVEDTETAIKQKQGDMSNVEKVGLTARERQKTFDEMLNTIGDSLSDLTSSDDEEDVEDEVEDDDTELGMLSEDDEPSWVMATISKTVQRRMQRSSQMQIKLYKFRQPGWGDVANNFHEGDVKSRTSEVMVPTVIKSHMDHVAAVPPPTTIGELLETPDIVPGISRVPQCTSQPGSRNMRVG